MKKKTREEPIAEAPKKKVVIKDAMLKEAERAAQHITDLVERNELQPYLNGTDINGQMVEDSYDITAEQVAMLGAYTMAVQLLENIKLIAEGKEPKKSESTATIEIQAIELKGGKMTKVNLDDIPQDVKDALRKIINEENENE